MVRLFRLHLVEISVGPESSSTLLRIPLEVHPMFNANLRVVSTGGAHAPALHPGLGAYGTSKLAAG
jgi:hypothetical protein